MIRAFEYLTNLAVRCPLPLPHPLPRGEGEGEGKQAAGLPLWQKIRPCPPNKSISESIFMQNQAKP